MGVGILGTGHYVPPKVVTNHDLEKIVDTNDEWIRTRSGIEERRIATDDIKTSDMAYEAAKVALEESGISAEDLDLIIVGTVTPDSPMPSTACLLQDRLGAKKAAAMDLSAACSGFIYSLVTGQQFIQNQVYKHVLVVGVEKLSKITNWEDRTTCVLFGDGAGAVVLGEVKADYGILASDLGANGTGGEHLYQDENNHLVQNGREVFKFAVRQMPQSIKNVTDQLNIEMSEIDFLIPHQANIRIMDAARERMGLAEDKMSRSITKYGNTSAASIPIALSEEVKQGKIKDGDLVVLVGFGGGLTWGSVILRWGK